jgi:hypothetical protein
MPPGGFHMTFYCAYYGFIHWPVDPWQSICKFYMIRRAPLLVTIQDSGLEHLAERAGCGDGQFWTWGASRRVSSCFFDLINKY